MLPASCVRRRRRPGVGAPAPVRRHVGVRRTVRRRRQAAPDSTPPTAEQPVCCWCADGDGTLRAFANICRHRGHELLACGATDEPRRDPVPVPRVDLRARRVAASGSARSATWPASIRRSSAWSRWASTRGAGGCSSTSTAAPVRSPITSAGSRRSRPTGSAIGWWSGRRHHYELRANWKVAIENYHECYHCPLIHPELCQVSPPDSGDNVDDVPGAFVGGSMVLEPHAATMSFDGESHGVPLPGLTDQQRREVMYINVFPNLLVSLHPDFVMTHRIAPRDADDVERRVPVAVRSGRGRRPDVRPELRRRLLGPHQPPGLGGGRERAARPGFAAVRARACSRKPRTRCTTSPRWWRRRISAVTLARRSVEPSMTRIADPVGRGRAARADDRAGGDAVGRDRRRRRAQRADRRRVPRPRRPAGDRAGAARAARRSVHAGAAVRRPRVRRVAVRVRRRSARPGRDRRARRWPSAVSRCTSPTPTCGRRSRTARSFAQWNDDARTQAELDALGVSAADQKGYWAYEDVFDTMRKQLRTGPRDSWIGDVAVAGRAGGAARR